ncbi:MAG: hypothetical protein ACK2T0_04250, partial [Anaerolineales bacterium]
MAANPLDPIRHQINAGDRQGARTALVKLLEAEPDNTDAWALLAILLADPDEQAQCYREILRINPNDRQAEAWLASLTDQPKAPVGGEPQMQEPPGQECPRCGETIKVSPLPRSPGGAIICPYCGFPVEPADAFGEQTPSEKHEQVGDTDFATMERIPEGTTLEQLLDQLSPPDGDKETAHPGHEPATAQHPAKQKGFLDGLLGRLRGGTGGTEAEELLMSQAEAASAAGALSPDLILRLAGGPLPPEERRKCPRCGAVVSRREGKC